ncbi:MAG: hypothetical protein KDA57_10945 [Planctomycetales bacterium]|nr:hypothetical protein [Planctomycetales bacterium]
MPDILFHYERVNPTSWAYLSSLLMLALFFKFNRIWSVRNIDLFLLISIAPGLLLVQWAWENMGIAENAQTIEYFGFVWLFSSGGMLLLRLLLDSAMVRRPLLEPNLNAAGLTFMGGALLFFLMANVVTGKPSASDLSPARTVEDVRAEQTEEAEVGQPDSFATNGPGYWLLYLLPRISTQKVVEAGPHDSDETFAEQVQQEQLVAQATARVMAILSHTMIVFGMVLVGYRHFDNLTAGLASATMYLMMPYTALWTGTVDHALPASLLVWAVVLYRRPMLAGMMVGLASGTMYYPVFLLPLWISFYWERGLKRFVFGVLLMIAVLVASMAFTSTSTETFLANLVQMFGLRVPVSTDLEGIWKTWSYYYRFPIIAAFVALSISFAIWPARKNLATLISGSGALMLAAQFWHPHGGGIFVAWYLPLLLMMVFRPNLEDRNALTRLDEGWWIVRQKAKRAAAAA